MTSTKLIRTFIAVELPHAVKQMVLNLQTTVTAKPKAVKWLKMSNIHLTLRFIGPTPEEEIPRINEAIKKAVEGHNDHILKVTKTGVFPKKERPKILWLGVEGEIGKIQNLVCDLNRELKQLGYPPEERKYHPHITVGRIRYPQKITPDVSNFLNSEYEPIEIEVQKVKFFQSDLVPGGPVYSILGIHELTPNS
ncbi:MAG: RNA 2',3'-cyclic phosphodiesterase [Candidatus Marinimicrobia bacterium]|nr:RNA 2',3'-cyclic phosphodiesterase [Candidatus Neomarinimicrobiota bacterium]